MSSNAWDTLIGVIILVAALGVLLGFVFWSRRRIGRISREGFASARRILKGMNGDERASALTSRRSWPAT